MTLLIVDPLSTPWCPHCPMYHVEYEAVTCHCNALDVNPNDNLGRMIDTTGGESPDWCPLRQGDVVVRFKGGGK